VPTTTILPFLGLLACQRPPPLQPSCPMRTIQSGLTTSQTTSLGFSAEDALSGLAITSMVEFRSIDGPEVTTRELTFDATPVGSVDVVEFVPNHPSCLVRRALQFDAEMNVSTDDQWIVGSSTARLLAFGTDPTQLELGVVSVRPAADLSDLAATKASQLCGDPAAVDSITFSPEAEVSSDQVGTVGTSVCGDQGILLYQAFAL